MRAYNPRFAVILLTVLLGWLWAIPSVQAAVVYVYTDESGNVHYSDYLSTIPQQFRSKARAKYVPGKKTAKSTTEGGTDDSQDSSSKSTSGKTMGVPQPEEVGLSKEEESLLQEAKGILGQMVAMADQFSGLRMSATTGRNMINSIQSKTSVKQALVDKIGGSQEGTLASIKGFLESSIAADKQSGTRQASKFRLMPIKNRIEQEAEKAKSLSEQIDQAIADSKAKQAEAKKKAEEEKKKAQEKEKTQESSEETTAEKK